MNRRPVKMESYRGRDIEEAAEIDPLKRSGFP